MASQIDSVSQGRHSPNQLQKHQSDIDQGLAPQSPIKSQTGGTKPLVSSSSAVNVIDFSRNTAAQQDTFMKLIAKNTFESEDYGIGLKNNKSAAKKKKRPKSSLTRGSGKSPEKGGAVSGGTGETAHAVAVVQDVNSMKFIDQIKFYATKRFGKKAQVNSNTYQEMCKKYLKNGTEISMSIDWVQRLDSKTFVGIIQDFKSIKTIQLYSEICTLQQLERKDFLITLPHQRQLEVEQKNFSQNQPDTCLLMQAFQMNMQESRCLKTLHLIGMKFSRSAFAALGEGIGNAKTLKRLLINQSNIGTQGLQELANGFATCSSIEYLDLQCNDLNDSHCWTLSKIISTQFEMRDNLKWKLGLRITQEIDVSKLGIRYLHLGKNLISNKGAIQMAQAIKQDAYMRAINLHKNKLGEAGILEMLSAVQFNKSILLMDVTGNSNVYEKKKINEQFKQALLLNLKQTIESYAHRAVQAEEESKKIMAAQNLGSPKGKSPKAKKGQANMTFKQSRINYEWIKPELLGCIIKNRDQKKRTASIMGEEEHPSRKSEFIQFASQIAQTLQLQYQDVAKAFIGDDYLQIFGKLRSSRSQITVQNSHGGLSKSRKGSISVGRDQSPPLNAVRFSAEELGDVNISLANKSASTNNFNQRPGALAIGKSISGFTSDSNGSKVKRIQSAKVRKSQAAMYAAANHELQVNKMIDDATRLKRGDGTNKNPKQLNILTKPSISKSCKGQLSSHPATTIGARSQQQSSARINQEMQSYIQKLELENSHLKTLMAQKGFSAKKQPPQLDHNNTPLKAGESDYYYAEDASQPSSSYKQMHNQGGLHQQLQAQLLQQQLHQQMLNSKKVEPQVSVNEYGDEYDDEEQQYMDHEEMIKNAYFQQQQQQQYSKQH